MSKLSLAFARCVAAAALAACTSSPGASSPQDAGFDSICGLPGDQGNSLGVGRFCQGAADCAGAPQPMLCSQIGDARTHICTFYCSPADAASPDGSTPFTTNCGENATCACNDRGQCGCTPNSCFGK